MSSKQLVWLITGTSTGLGREMTLQALERGDKVIATARGRSFAKLADLKEKGADTLELDVTAPLDTLHEFAKQAVAIHGRIDVLVNNAGYIENGALEELTPDETYAQFNTNVFAPLNMCRAFLPYMRPRKTGTVVWIGSIAGYTGNAGFGLYSATKYATRCLSESLDQELSPLGLRSLCFECGYFRTDFLQAGHRADEKERIADYGETAHKNARFLASYSHKQPGDPKKGVKVILDFVRGEGPAAGREVPPSLILGSDTYKDVHDVTSSLLKRIEDWKDVVLGTDLPADA